MNPCFAIIGRNTLECMALKDILWEAFNHVEVFTYNSMESFIKDSNRHFVHFFVNSEILFSNTEEFDTLKTMTTVLTEGRNLHLEDSGYLSLDLTMDEEDIVDSLINLQNIGHYGRPRENSNTSEEKQKEKLSHREKEVLRLMVKGLINKEIAKELNISMTTVIYHRNNICEKLQTRSIGKLTIFAVLSGIVDIKEI